jgi:ATP-binding protein involved in chromosome partitioning
LEKLKGINMAIDRELLELNVGKACNSKCDSCERYFECDLPRKELFKKKGIIGFIEENLKNVKHKVLSLGGKGGVGKSMVAVNLATELAKRGRTVCVLDQCYDCPAIPMMFGIPDDYKMYITDVGLEPAETIYGPKVISTGLILDPDEVIVWFSDMKRNATEELLSSVDYGKIDYLVCDIATGTSSETVNILKYLPRTDGALVVTVPSSVSQNVARKCIYILNHAGVPYLGVVENMSDSICPVCGTPVSIIAKGAGERMAKEEGVDFLGRIPVSDKVATTLDDGVPFVVRYPDSIETKAIIEITDAVIKKCEG